MTTHFDIEEVRTFVLLAENGNFTETALALGITQPAVSQRIARLENSCGLVLFTRLSERATLTPYGAEMLSCARRCVASHEAMAHRLSKQDASTDKVRVWVDHSVIGERLAALIDQEAPENIHIERVTAFDGSAWIERLRHFDCDIALSGVFLQSEAPQDLSRIELRQDPGLSAIWSPSHYPLDANAFTFGEVMQTTLILASERLIPGFRSFIEDWCRRAYGRVPVMLEFHSCDEVLRACQAGRGIGLLPGHAAHLNLAEYQVQSRRLFDEVLPNAYAYGMHLRSTEKSDTVIRTASWLISVYKKHVPKPLSSVAEAGVRKSA